MYFFCNQIKYFPQKINNLLQTNNDCLDKIHAFLERINDLLREIPDFLQKIRYFLKKIGRCSLHRVKCGRAPTALRNDAKAPYPYPWGEAWQGLDA